MKRLLLLFTIFLSSTLWAQEPVSFQTVLPKVGQTFARTTGYKMTVDVILKFAGESLKEYNEVSSLTIRKAETILQTNGDAISKLRVTYELVDDNTVITEEGIAETEKKEKSHVLGRTYIVIAQPEGVKVTDGNGLKPSEAEIEILESDYEALGKPDSYMQFLRQKTIRSGEPLQMPGVLAEGIFMDSERRKVRVDSASFILKTVRQNVAVFDTALKMQWNSDANTSLKMNLTGETQIGIQNSRRVSSTLSGALRVTGTDQIYNRLVMVDGKGKITITQSLQMR